MNSRARKQHASKILPLEAALKYFQILQEALFLRCPVGVGALDINEKRPDVFMHGLNTKRRIFASTHTMQVPFAHIAVISPSVGRQINTDAIPVPARLLFVLKADFEAQQMREPKTPAPKVTKYHILFLYTPPPHTDEKKLM